MFFDACGSKGTTTKRIVATEWDGDEGVWGETSHRKFAFGLKVKVLAGGVASNLG